IDLVIDRSHPDILYAAAYECMRFPWRLADGGPSSGIYKTTNGGAIWSKLGGGLPEGAIGRIGLDLYQKKPDTLYAVIDNRNGIQESRPAAPLPAAQGEKLIGGEVYRTDDAGSNWRRMNSAKDDVSRKTGYAFNQIRVDPDNADRIFITG